MSGPVDVVLERLDRVKRSGDGWIARCPAHEDRNPSLSVGVGDDGRVLLHCHAGCTTDAIAAAAGIEVRDLYPQDHGRAGAIVAVFPYVQADGRVAFESVRFEPKRFALRRPDGNGGWIWKLGDAPRVLYRLPEVVETVAAGQRAVFVVEGEKHADLLRGRGLIATTCPMGAGKWRPEHADALAGAARVFVLADDDTPGREHADQVARSLHGRVGELKVVELFARGESKRDVVDFYADADGHPEQADRALVAIVERTPAYVPADGTSPTATSGTRARLIRIADVTPKRVEWVEPDVIACDVLTGLVAPGGTVKGLYGIHIAAKLATRDERTLFVCSEDALDYIVRPRFQAAGCDGRLAYALSVDTDAGERVPRFPSDLPVLEAAIAEVQPRLVIVDPVASYIDPGLDMGKNNEMRLILQPLIDLARTARVAILVVYHLGKHRDRGAIGTVAFEDACRQVLTAARDDDDEDVRHVELTKSNIGPTGYGRRLRIVGVPLDIDGEVVEVAKLVDEGPSWKSVHALLARREPPGPEPEKRKVARDLLVDGLVAGGTVGINADEAKRVIAEKAAVSEKTVWRAFTELKAEGLATGQQIRDEYGSILEWRWVPKLALLVGRNDA